MASVKVKFRVSSNPDKEGTLFYQVIHGRVARQIHTGYKVYPSEWDEAHGGIILPGDGGDRLSYLLSVREALSADLDKARAVIRRLDKSGEGYTADKVVALYRTPLDDGGLISFGRKLTGRLEQIGKRRTAETYTTTVNSFSRFRKGRDVPLDEVDSTLMQEYENSLKEEGVCPNTSSYYMRNLRAIYNRAVEQELTPQRYPFKHVYTGIDKTVKRAISARVIHRIRELDLSLHPASDFARDVFMFLFYTRGMSFIDMAYLKKKDLQNGVLSYRRQKTNRRLFIKWEKPMQDIIDKYDTTGSPYLLPVITDMGKDKRRQYKNAAHLVNARLKEIGEQLGLDVPLTTYVARHSWASIAKSKNVPVGTISEAMGHDSENTTRIYLASLDTSNVDKANSIVMKSV